MVRNDPVALEFRSRGTDLRVCKHVGHYRDAAPLDTESLHAAVYDYSGVEIVSKDPERILEFLGEGEAVMRVAVEMAKVGAAR